VCGIIGIVSKQPLKNQSWLGNGRDTMIHRGPDSAGEWWSNDGKVGFGHRRLSILERSPLGHQPMQDISKDLCVVFNGEIYNFEDLRKELLSKGAPI